MTRIANRYNHGLTENDVTDPRLFRERRKFIRNSIAGGTGLALASYFPVLATAAVAGLADRIKGANKTRNLEEGDELNTLDQITQYNNFYELGTGKEDPAKYAEALKTDPWSVRIDGECAKPGTYTLEDILKPHDLEERIYRLRCVEAWSMVIPWVGFSLGDLLKRFEPTSKAKYVAFETVYDRGNLLPGQKRQTIEWPYREGLRMDEAMHPLTMAVVGLYGEILPNQNGAPLRLVVPWKYGYKSIKSIVKISFVENEPPTSWNMAIPHEYGFYSNVNPAVDHPRWSQATERRIGEFFKRDTLVLNGYPEAASLYSDRELADYF